MRAGIRWLTRLHGGKRAERVAEAYRQTLDPQNPKARLILSDLAHYCRVGQTSFVAGDPHQTAFNEGARDVFLHIAESVALRPEDFPRLIEDIADER